MEKERLMALVRRWVLLIALIAAFVALAACGKSKRVVSVAEPQNMSSDASPTTLAGVPAGAETQRLTIEHGKFNTDELRLQERQSATLVIVNKDATAYTLVTDGLLASVSIPPNQTTPVSLTTTTAGRYPTTLTAAGATKPADTFTIIIQGPGGR
jgi:hypothetical protein